MLKRFAETEHASLFVDVGLESGPRPFDFHAPGGTDGLDRLAVAIDRSWSIVDGTYVYRRLVESGDLRESPALRHIHQFLRPLGVLDLNSLREGGLTFASLNSTQQRALRYVIASSGDGVGDSMLANYPNRIGMRLVLKSKLSAESKTAHGIALLELPNENARVPLPKSSDSDVVIDPLGGPEDGDLDFGGGELLTLGAMVEKANLTFGQNLTFDRRLVESVYFISGRFTPRRFFLALAAVTVPASITIVGPDDANGRNFGMEPLKQLVFGPYRSDKIGLAGLTIGDALESRSMTFLSAFGDRPPQNVQAFMYEHRLEPSDVFKVSADLVLSIAAPGMATLYSTQRDALGSAIPYNVPHLINIAL